MEPSYKINRLHKIKKRRNISFVAITITILILSYVVLWFISKPQDLLGLSYLMVTVTVLIFTYAALITNVPKKIIFYVIVMLFILVSVIIAYLGKIEQM